jgi:hypothetical protein
MIGNMQGDHITDRGRGTGYTGERLHNPERNFQPTKFGNEIALNVGGGGPGKGRTVYASGSQGTTGAPAAGNPPAQGRDILGGYGPESSRGR